MKRSPAPLDTPIAYEVDRRKHLEADPDIALQLDRAFANPRKVTLKGRPRVSREDLQEREQYFSPHASVPDSIKIRSFESQGGVNDVITEDPTKYPLLLAQAMQRLEIAKGLADPGVTVTPHLEKVVRHETTHGEMAAAFGVGTRYGIGILYDPDEDTWALSPFHSQVGDASGAIMLTRLEEAAIAAAPIDASEGDLHTVRSLGYSSREEVLERLYEVRPDLRPTA